MCTSTKYVETKEGYKNIVSSVFTTKQVKKLMVGNVTGRLKTELATHSEMFLQSISLSKRLSKFKWNKSCGHY